MGKLEKGEALTAQVDAAIDELSEQLTQGHSQAYLDLLDFYDKQFHKYSLANLILIMRQKPYATRCRGYEQWKTLGCQVRKGETGAWIRAPWLRKEIDQETGEKVERLIGYIGVTVFDVSQVDGAENLPSPAQPMDGDWEALHDALCFGALRNGITVSEHANFPFGIYGRSTGGRIEVDIRLSVSERSLVIIHELAHEVLHQREDKESGVQVPKRQRELEAESTAYLLARTCGLDNPTARDYILSYKGTVEGLQQSLSRIYKAVQTIASWIAVKEETPAIAAD